MREWNLRAGDPLSLFLAADARLGVPDYADDQVWELTLRGGDPPALAAETMLGLRAVSLRVFPIFVVGSRPVQDPDAFASPPAVRRFAPNYLEVRCAPVPGLEAACEYWVPESHALAGRITLRPAGSEPVSGECWLGGVLRPAAEGAPFAAESAGPYEGAYLRGRLRNSIPVLMAAPASGAGRGAIPSLRAAFEIDPGRTRSFRWAFGCLSSVEESLRLARSVLAREWDAEIARVELVWESTLDFQTGRDDWDAVLAFSQQTALQALIGRTRRLPHPSPVIGRNPERGYSLRGDGSDYPPAWRGADLGDLLMILPALAPARPELAKGLLRNFLAAAGEGLPDARPDPGKARAGSLAPPLLAQAAWRALAGSEDADFLREVWPLVDRCLEAWFDPARDRDGDGAPEWDRADALGPLIPPMWAREDPWGGWVHPEEVGSPSLAALLLGECPAAARMAERVGENERAQHWKKRSQEVQRALERMETAGGYRTVDRVTRSSPHGEVLWEGGAGQTAGPDIRLKEPARLLLRCRGAQETRPVVRVVLDGRDAQGKSCREEFLSERFSWMRGAGSCHTGSAWSRIDSIRTEGPGPAVTFRLEIPDLQREDLSHFLPLWARVAPRRTAERLFDRLAPGTGFDSPAGLRFVPASDPAAGIETAGGVSMFWNMLMGEAAIRYGREGLALEWIERWMRALAASLRADRAFRCGYSPALAGGSGPRNSLQGIFPVGLFLAAMGVHPAGSGRVWAGGRSIFPFPIALRWKGMILTREGDSLRVQFPSGAERVHQGTDRTLISDAA
jgi:hypothetical protein